MPDVLVICLLTAISGLGIAMLGLLAVRVLARRSLILSTSAVAVVSILGVLTGALVAAHAMFLSSHDLGVLALVCLVAGVVGIVTSVALARVVVAGSSRLGTAAAGLADGTYTSIGSLPAELAQLDQRLVEASDRLSAARGRERALEASRRELIAWISHDLRTPLAGIRAMAEALDDGVAHDADTVTRYHAGLRREAERLTAMVDDLFELSRIHSSAIALTVDRVCLSDLVSDALATAGPVAAAKGVRLESEALEGLPPVQGGLRELGRVLHNLLSNAIRHTPADGVVSVRGGAQDGLAYLEVADSCGGIPAEDLPRVFDVAFRGTSARTPADDGGAGLGLAIARGLVEAHHGQISIENDGPGCRVLVRIPLP